MKEKNKNEGAKGTEKWWIGRRGQNWQKEDEGQKDDAGNEVDVDAEEDKEDKVGERYIGNKAEEWDKVDEGE